MLRELNDEPIKENKIFPIKKGMIFAKVAPLAVGERAFQGANFYTAKNPEYGVQIRYHLTESLKTKKSERKSKDRKLNSAGKDVPYPSWDDLKAEDREVAPKVTLTIRDADGEVVKRIPGSTSKGIHVANWDLRHGGFGGRGGPLAIPGTYTVDIAKTVDGETTELVAATEFEIEPLTFGDTSGPDRESIMEFVKKASELSKTVNAATSVAAEANTQLAAIRRVIERSTTLDPAMLNDVRELEVRMMDIMEKFNGDPTKTRRNESAYPGLNSRLRTMMMAAMGSTEGPTGTHRQQYDIVAEEYGEVIGDLKQVVEVDLPALNEKLDDAGAPWTPGRKIPDLK